MLTTNEIIGQNILKILDNNGMTQVALADKLNWTRQDLNKIIHGRKNITAQELKQISETLAVSMEELTKEELVHEDIEPIKLFLGQVETPEARLGLLHAQEIMDLILFHSQIQEEKWKLMKEWDA